MAQVPANPKLWAMLTAQARARFRVYPSPAASHWVHEQYTQKGGRFVATRSHTIRPGRSAGQDSDRTDAGGDDDDTKEHKGK